jgi:DNA polymerase-1
LLTHTHHTIPYHTILHQLLSIIILLQALVDKNNRVHCSLNLNTETGRLSSRRPNLQNQPALEKDQYKIRDAFIAEEGNTFIVADYGQLELRVLAHISNCTSMIDAFKKVRYTKGEKCAVVEFLNT